MIPDLDLYTDHAWITTIQTVMKVEEHLTTVPVIRLSALLKRRTKLKECLFAFHTAKVASYLLTEHNVDLAQYIIISTEDASLQMLRNFVGHEHFRKAIIMAFIER